MLLGAIITIVLAFVFYTWGVFGEKIKGKLTGKFLSLFWIGFVFDTTGTTLMSMISTNPQPFHKITGMAAIILMLIHALWGSLVYFKKDEKWIKNFHKFSLFVWLIWLIPFLSGMFFGASR
ncbi:membrane protein [Marinitoga sp. 1135]|uniref:HsmA family protein n=1 Tax=unclassified Marinitoga TaxID=2640159 RepID=UPI000950AFF5|nr:MULTISPECIES: HsmA family protein [unclassified Marinitoga]APT75845.1 membrane protein [Marinitoga sp. 1137]NUU95620.1 membrane protein [Marinitoga sp. 1135]